MWIRNRRLAPQGAYHHRDARWKRPSLSILLALLLLATSIPHGLALGAPLPQESGPGRVRHTVAYPPRSAPAAPRLQAVASTVSAFAAVADAEVRSGAPAQNFGIQTALGVGYSRAPEEPRQAQRSLLNFSITGFLPPKTTIHSAQLQIYLGGYCYYAQPGVRPPLAIQTNRIAGDWSEMGVTWNNQPPIGEAYESKSILPIEGWYSFDITALARNWVGGTLPEYGIELRGPEASANPCAYHEFVSKGGGGYTIAPRLLVDYTLPAPALALPQPDIVFTQQCGVGAPAPAAQRLEIQSNTETLGDWTASVTGGAGWLSLSKTSGKVSWLFPDRVALTVSEVAPCPTTLTAKVQINAPALGAPRTATITFRQTAGAPYRHVYLPLVLKPSAALANSPGQAPSANVKRIAILIGVADYEKLGPPAVYTDMRAGGWGADLLAPVSDLFAMLQQLRASFNRIIILRERQAIEEQIDRALDEIADESDYTPGAAVSPAASAPSIELFIYDSGHGGQAQDFAPLDEQDNKDEFLGLYNTDVTPQLVNAIIDDKLKTRLAGLNVARVGIALDVCNSGGIEISNPNRAVLSASKENQNSWESGKLEHGVFTYYMLKAMQDPASDSNHDSWLSIAEIYNYARGPVVQFTKSLVQQDLQLNLTADFNVVRIQPAGVTRRT